MELALLLFVVVLFSAGLDAGKKKKKISHHPLDGIAKYEARYLEYFDELSEWHSTTFIENTCTSVYAAMTVDFKGFAGIGKIISKTCSSGRMILETRIDFVTVQVSEDDNRRNPKLALCICSTRVKYLKKYLKYNSGQKYENNKEFYLAKKQDESRDYLFVIEEKVREEDNNEEFSISDYWEFTEAA